MCGFGDLNELVVISTKSQEILSHAKIVSSTTSPFNFRSQAFSNGNYYLLCDSNSKVVALIEVKNDHFTAAVCFSAPNPIISFSLVETQGPAEIYAICEHIIQIVLLPGLEECFPVKPLTSEVKKKSSTPQPASLAQRLQH